jgi:RNA recognition motif-containing protein
MKLYVGNLSYNTSEDDLKDAFSAHGEVASAKIITDRDTGRLKGFGFVEFNDDEAGRKAMTAMNGTDLGGRNLTVNEARPQTDRPRGGAGAGGERSGSRGGNRY